MKHTLILALSCLMTSTAVSAQPAGEPAPKALEASAKKDTLTWNNVEPRLTRETADGYSGAILMVRDGKVALDKGYGLADRDRNIPNTPNTIFGIGSTPIDFTKAAILLLAERGQLSLSDPISKFFATDQVPEDKRAITLDHLMTSRSGLPDFHDAPTDADPDHAWIDRDEAVSRILASTLVFAPGAGDEHSHSAYGLLAAIIEIVTKESYGDFLRRELFAPAGMKDTGFFGEPLPSERTAVGYGKKSGEGVNSPPNWGKTSWLVMGSGGMTSTTRDLRRWIDTVNAGKLIPARLVGKYMWRPGSVFDGGDMHGYQIVYTTGPDSLLIIVTNGFDGTPRTGRRFRRLAEDLATLVQPAPAPYTLGVQFNVDGGHVLIDTVFPDSAGSAAGLEDGDRIVSINGEPLGEDFMSVLSPLLKSPDPIAFEVERGHDKLTIKVTPKKREPRP